MIRVVAHLVELQRKTGRTVTLAIEPEPACFLEKTTETITYFKNHLYADSAVDALARQTGMSQPRPETPCIASSAPSTTSATRPWSSRTSCNP